MSCRDCKFWEVEADYPQLGECRRYPPAVLGGTNVRDDEEEGFDPIDPVSVMMHSVWPITTHVGWCGEFEVR